MKAFVERLSDWKHWPFGVFYFPLMPVWAWYCLRSRSPWFFSSSNPGISFGGFEGEPKSQIYSRLPTHLYPRTIYIEADLPVPELEMLVESAGFTYPFVVKPDVGMEGLLFRKIENNTQLRDYHLRMPVRYLVQEYVDLPLEVSIFYIRRPGEKKGRVSAFIRKDLPFITGDGLSTVSELLASRQDATSYYNSLKRQLAPRWNHRLASGETLFLSLIANRTYGSEFTDLSHLIDDRLSSAFDVISHNGSFYYGRYDIKCSSVESMTAEQKFIILEFNGAGSIPNHVFAGGYSLLGAYREIVRHWHALFEISRINLRNGVKRESLVEGYRYLSRAKAHFRRLKKLNAHQIEGVPPVT